MTIHNNNDLFWSPQYIIELNWISRWQKGIMMNHETAKEAETIAKRMAKETGQPEGLFELFLMDAYKELSNAEKKKE